MSDAPKKPWQMNHREKVEFFAQLVESFETEVPGAKKIAAEVRSHRRVPKATKVQIYDAIVIHPQWTAKQISAELGASYSHVIGAARRMKISARPLTAAERSAIVKESLLKRTCPACNKQGGLSTYPPRVKTPTYQKCYYCGKVVDIVPSSPDK